MSIDSQITSAVGAHSQWKSRLRAAIASGTCDMPDNVARDDHQCAFGKWLHGTEIDATIKKSKHWETCAELHRRFHIAAAGVLSLAIAKKKQEASKALEDDQEFSKLSFELTKAMMAWKAAQA